MEYDLITNPSFWLPFPTQMSDIWTTFYFWLEGLRFTSVFLGFVLGYSSPDLLVSRTSLKRTNLLMYHSQKMEESAPRRGRVAFGWLVGLSQLLGLVSVVLTGVWMGHYKGGFAWDGSAQQFNVHPLCMVLGLVFLQGDGESTNTQPLFCECVPSSFFPQAFGAAGVKWIMDFHPTATRHVCLIASTWHVKPPSYISIIYTTADRNAVTAVPGSSQSHTRMLRNAENLLNF